MTSIHNPASIAPPSSAYGYGVKIDHAKSWLHVSGQVGTHPDGTLAGGTAEKMEVCWQRIITIVEDAGMKKEDIVKVTAYLTNAEDVGIYRGICDQMLGGHTTASTLLIVSALADPNWTVEIEAIAAALVNNQSTLDDRHSTPLDPGFRRGEDTFYYTNCRHSGAGRNPDHLVSASIS